MGDATGQILAFAVAAGISPIPIIGVILMLATPRARSNGPAFVLGWVVGVATVGTIVLLLVIGAAAAIAQTGAAAGAQAAALAIFTLITSLGTAIPVALYLALGERSRQTLDSIQDWMRQNNAAIMTVVCLVIGAKLIGDAISGFAG